MYGPHMCGELGDPYPMERYVRSTYVWGLGDPYPMERYVRSTYVWGIRRSLSHGVLCKVHICVGN